MRIGIDVSMIDTNKAGIGYYAYSLLKALSELDKQNSYFLLTYDKNLLSDIKFSSNFEIIEIPGTGNLKWMISCLLTIRSLKLDQFLSPSNLFWGCILPNTTTVIHDVAQIAHPEFFYKKGNLLYKLELNILLKRKGRIVEPSKSVESELHKYFPGVKPSVHLITEGLHEWVSTPASEELNKEIAKKYNLPSKYILFVGTLEPRKNIESLIKAFAEFRKGNLEHKLVIVGKKGWFYEQIYKTVHELNLHDSVQFLGYVPDSDLPYVLDLSSLVVNLSFYEGFGLPLIEANARNKQVLASNIDVYREFNIQGGFVAPNAPSAEIADLMAKLVDSYADNSAYIFATYSWKFVAGQLLNMWTK